MRNGRNRLKHSGKLGNKENELGEATRDQWLPSITNQNQSLQQKAQAHLNYLSELDINLPTADGTDRANRISAWFTSDEKEKNCHPTKTITQFRKELTQSKDSTTWKTVPPRSNQLIEMKLRQQSPLQVRDYLQRRRTQDDATLNEERPQLRCSHTIILVEQPRRGSDLIDKVRSNSVNNVNSQVAQLIHRTLLRRKRKLTLDVDKIMVELEMSKERASRRQCLLKRSLKKSKSPCAVSPPSVLVGDGHNLQKSKLVKINQFMKELTNDENSVCQAHPSRKASRKRPRFQTKPVAVQQLRSTTTESFANNRLVRELYLRYDEVINRCSKRNAGGG